MVKQVKEKLCYIKEVELNGELELVEVSLTDMRKREAALNTWCDSMEVGLKLLDIEKKELSAEDIVDRWELLRDCWLELAEGL